MFDETDLSREWKWYNSARSGKVIDSLKRLNVEAQYASNRDEARSMILNMIPEGAIVARGDSVSVDEVGIIATLRKRGQNKIIDPHERDCDGRLLFDDDTKLYLAREAFHSDVFITGTNAITLDGRLFNVDGLGNRVSAMIFGPRKVVVVLGINKIVDDLQEAYKRVHQLAARMNAKRHASKHHWPEFADLPCVTKGVCANCLNDYCMCRFTTIISGNLKRDKGRMNVVIVGENLGI